jgi:flavin reductase (DIM6/NTAB) family NADH-FMN oxidoreductase RutF
MTKRSLEPGTALTPVPAVLVSAGTMTSADITTLAWVGTVCSDPPLISIAVRPSRFLHHFIVEGGAFVVNVADSSHVRQLDYCGMVSGRDVDKWAACGFTREQGSVTSVPLVAECPLSIECVVEQTLHLGSHDLFIGRVVAVHAEDHVLCGQHVDAAGLDPVCYVTGQYRRMGDLLGRVGFSREADSQG